MSTLENTNQASYQNTVLRYGLIAGMVSIIFSLITYMTDLAFSSVYSSLLLLLVSLVISVTFIFLAIKTHRDQDLGGYITFGRAFLVGLLVAIVSGVIGTIFTFVYTNYIDPNYWTNAMAGIEELYSNMGMSEDQIEMAMESVRKNAAPGRTILNGMLGALIGGSILSLIVAAILKKNPEEGTTLDG